MSSSMPLGDIKQKMDGTYELYNHSKTFDVFYEQQYPINTQTGLTQIESMLGEVYWMFSNHIISYFLFRFGFQLNLSET